MSDCGITSASKELEARFDFLLERVVIQAEIVADFPAAERGLVVVGENPAPGASVDLLGCRIEVVKRPGQEFE
jgi:hypothetical protein